MLIKQLTTSWPPAVTVRTEQAPNLEDTVIGVRKGSDGNLALMLRKTTTKTVYGLLLLLPDDVLVDKALAEINLRIGLIGLTLQQVGELAIS